MMQSISLFNGDMPIIKGSGIRHLFLQSISLWIVVFALSPGTSDNSLRNGYQPTAQINTVIGLLPFQENGRYIVCCPEILN
jgi:hypothetical protein